MINFYKVNENRSYVHINFPGLQRKSHTMFLLAMYALKSSHKNVHMIILHCPDEMWGFISLQFQVNSVLHV